MNVLNVMVGFFFGFSLGVGCALAVMYSIYTGGYRKALSDSLLEVKPRVAMSNSWQKPSRINTN